MKELLNQHKESFEAILNHFNCPLPFSKDLFKVLDHTNEVWSYEPKNKFTGQSTIRFIEESSGLKRCYCFFPIKGKNEVYPSDTHLLYVCNYSVKNMDYHWYCIFDRSKYDSTVGEEK